MSHDPWLLVLGAVALVALVVALVALPLTVRLIRRSTEANTARLAAEQAETMRWVSDQLGVSLDRFHGRLAEFGQQVTATQGVVGETVLHGLSEQLQAMSSTLNSQLAMSRQALGDGLNGATEVFGRLQGRIGQVAEMAARMDTLASSVDQLGSILRVPKLRGVMGEHSLEAILRQVLPRGTWETQHRFADGRVVDVVVRLGDRLLPVDAKFPLEAYRRVVEAEDESARTTARVELGRAVKGRIDEIASRYIRPGEETTDFALMFIPAEGVYAEIVAGASSGALLDQALQRRVVPVSPATLFAYLAVVSLGLRGLDVGDRARQIVDGLGQMEQELAQLRQELGVVGRHLNNAMQRFVEAERRLGRVEAGLARIGHSSQG